VSIQDLVPGRADSLTRGREAPRWERAATARRLKGMALSAAVPSAAADSRWLRAARDAAYLGLGALTGTLAFGVWIAGVTASVTFALLIVGLPVVIATFAVFRRLADLERRRAALVLGAPIPSVYRGRDGGLGQRLLASLTDPQSWKDLAYLGVFGVLGFTWGTLWASAWGFVLGSLTIPAWWWAMPDDASYLWFELDRTTETLIAPAAGLIALPVALLLQRSLAVSQAAFARWLLAPSLAARVEELKKTRAGAVDTAAADLERIERDLHDGAQARLVALSMDLGMAEERFDRDPEGARELVGEAREEARRALAELRDLARGIRPSLLTERGLAAAVAALAARSPIPATAHVDVDVKPGPAVETAAWFVVSEALANAAKHSEARHVTVWLTRRDDELRVEVVDDGRGGANPTGGGLQGLANRVAALDGTLEVYSPPGGPTVVRASLPCA
jgi:signal transduction histidine kinase